MRRSFAWALPFVLIVLICVLSTSLQAPAQVESTKPLPVPEVEHYKLLFRLDPEHHTLAGEARLSFRNTADRPLTSVPVLLYRLMDIENASDAEGKPLAFTQKVVKFADDATWQVNYVEVKLPMALPPQQSATIQLKYGGPLLGYREVMQYVRDTIAEEYSLIREETMAYPFVAIPTNPSRRRFVMKSNFDYEVETIVPAGLIAVCSGKEAGEPKTEDGRTAYHCTSTPGSSDVSVAVAKFRVFDDPQRNLRVYAMAGDAEAGTRVMGDMSKALDFFRSYLGEVHGGGVTMIEIPDGWGSYAQNGKIFQSAAAFKDKAQANELYHEVAHRWNVCTSLDAKPSCRDQIQRTRYFDEAFASYFEAVAVRQFQGEEKFRTYMQRSREYFTRGATRDPRGRTTSIADYWREELGGFSYTKGAWSLYVLHQLLGEEVFRRSIAEFLSAYSGKPVEFEDFRRALEKSSGRDLQAWFDQWILAGNASSALLIEGKSVEEMAAQCQAPSLSKTRPRP